MEVCRNYSKLRSVPNLTGILFPDAKSGQCFVTHNLNHGNLTFGTGPGEFGEDGGVIEACFGGVGCQTGEIDLADSSPVNCAQAGRATLGR